MSADRAPVASTRPLLLTLFFLSGFAGLVYEILWMRGLRPVFGSGTQAAAATLAVYFAGMAAGNAFFGRRLARARRPLLVYARLELGTALTAVGCLLLPPAHVRLWAYFGGSFGAPERWLLPAQIVLAAALLLPPAFLIGGTLPAMGQVLVRSPAEVARTTGLLYAVNTGGAAAGALVAGFWLPQILGFRGAYLATMGLSLALALFGRGLSSRIDPPYPPNPARPPGGPIPRWITGYAFAAGFASLALEVLWTRMLALVLDSSVYAFTLILVVFLAALAVGGALCAAAAARLSAEVQLFGLLVGASLLVAFSPWALHATTGQLGSIPPDWGIYAYLLLAVGIATVAVLPAAALGGAVLPSLLRFFESAPERPGRLIGTLFGANTAGGVLGSLLGGFVLLPSLGLWRSISIVAVAYAGLALFAVSTGSPVARFLRPAALAAAVLVGAILEPGRLALVRTDPGERTEHVWETSAGIVAITEDDRGRRIRVDNTYVLGGTEGRDEEEIQAELALARHGGPRRVFFLGLGTGITAATALRAPVERVFVAEILPEVIAASRGWFTDEAGALYRDDRAEVVAVDGRLHLATSPEVWDLIVSDLFVPWHESTASLYTQEHFRVVRSRLAPGGVFVQWLPLFQLTREDFDTIAHTLTTVFSDVELWTVDLREGDPIAALVARVPGGETAAEPRPRPPPPAARRLGGNLSESPLFDRAPVHTDDRPILEHRAPLSRAAVRSGQATWLVGPELDRLRRELERAAVGPGSSGAGF